MDNPKEQVYIIEHERYTECGVFYDVYVVEPSGHKYCIAESCDSLYDARNRAKRALGEEYDNFSEGPGLGE